MGRLWVVMISATWSRVRVQRLRLGLTGFVRVANPDTISTPTEASELRAQVPQIAFG
jgi:hypothetical protein